MTNGFHLEDVCVCVFFFHLCGLTDKVVKEIAMVDRAQQIFIYKLQVDWEYA